MLIAVIILCFTLILLGTWLYWRRINPNDRQDFSQAVKDNSYALLALLALVSLPAALLMPLPDWAPGGSIAVVSLALWGLFLIAHWEVKVVPDKVLRDQAAAPYRPHFVPRPVPGSPGDEPVTPAVGDVFRQFRWTFTPRDGIPQRMEINLALSSRRYEEARAEKRRSVGNWAHYAEKEMPELDALAAEFYRLHKDRGWSTLEQASNVLCFTQSCIAYALDEETTPAAEWPRYPIETLVDETGDCEDDVILSTAALKRLGFDVALLYYSGEPGSPGHCALGVAGADGLPGAYVSIQNGQKALKFFYGEATAEGWLLGEVPDEYLSQQPEKVERVTRPVEG